MSTRALNDFLRKAATDAHLRAQLHRCDARAAAALARSLEFEVTVGDLTRYKARATSWQLTDVELAVVADWQAGEQSYWWQYIGAVE